MRSDPWPDMLRDPEFVAAMQRAEAQGLAAFRHRAATDLPPGDPDEIEDTPDIPDTPNDPVEEPAALLPSNADDDYH